MKKLYEVLGISEDSTSAQIKASFRSLAQKNHPDKGGDTKAMQAIQQAYDVLSDPEKRAEYDATGIIGTQGSTLRDKAMAVIVQGMAHCIEKFDPDGVNILMQCKKLIQQGNVEVNQEAHELRQKAKKVDSAIKRMRAAKGKDDSMAQVLAHLKQGFEEPLKKCEQQLAELKMALDILGEHEYEFDEPAIMTHSQFEMNVQRAGTQESLQNLMRMAGMFTQRNF